MRLTTIFAIVLAALVSTVAAGRHKPTECEKCTAGYNKCKDRCRDHFSERYCKNQCDCEKGKDEICHACGYGTICTA